MKEYFQAIIAAFFAGCIVMILHELPRALYLYIKIKNDKNLKNRYRIRFGAIFRLWKYIDPLGLLFCIISGAGFSKNGIIADEHKFNKKTSIVGFSSLIIQFLISIILLRFVFNMDGSLAVRHNNNDYIYTALLYLVTYVALLSMGMLITNFFPIRFFDAMLFVSGKRKLKLVNLNMHDSKMMFALLFVYFTGIISIVCQKILVLFLS